jgi:DNA-binding CsgD family transcriptional regulator
MTYSASVVFDKTLREAAAAFAPGAPNEPVLRLAKTAAAIADGRPQDLHLFATHADSLSNESVQLATLWQKLKSAHLRVVGSGFTETRCYIVLEAQTPSDPLLDHHTRLGIVEGILCGESQKNLAIDLEVAASTIALNARLGFAALGVLGRASRVHPLLMLAAKADRDGDAASSARTSSILIRERRLTVVSADRPDAVLANRLPPAELSVVRKLAEGVSYQDIAKSRGTSTRTIANQITAVFRRMKVSGRNDLLLRMFAERARAEDELTSAPPPVSLMRPVPAVVRRLEDV